MDTTVAPTDAQTTQNVEKKHNSGGGHGQYGSFVAYCFCVNYILGVGVLSVPHAFVSGGLLLGPLMLLLISIIAIVAFIWIAETMARAEAFADKEPVSAANVAESTERVSLIANDASQTTATTYGSTTAEADAQAGIQTQSSFTSAAAVTAPSTESLYGPLPTEGDQVTPKVDESSIADGIHIESKFLPAPEFKITSRKFELNELVKLFLGRGAKVIYEFFIALYLYGALWSYSTVFSSSVAANVPMFMPINGTFQWYTCNVLDDYGLPCSGLYIIYILIFALVVIPMTCLNLTEQKAIQVLMAIFRFVCLGLMTFIIFFAMFFDPYSRFEEKPEQAIDMRRPYVSDFALVDVLGFFKLLPVCMYAQILHHSIPGLSQPVKDKSKLTRIFTAVFISTFSFYTLLGISLGAYYGKGILSTCSLNFLYFRGGASFDEPIPVWAKIVMYIVILFPAIDVLSAFPLNAITLGNNMFAAFFTGSKYHKYRSIEILFRLSAAIPPVIASMFVRDLGKILEYVGLAGFVLTFIFPALLTSVSRLKAQKRFGKSVTPYTVPILSSPLVCYGTIALTAAAILYCIVTNILSNVGVLK